MFEGDSKAWMLAGLRNSLSVVQILTMTYPGIIPNNIIYSTHMSIRTKCDKNVPVSCLQGTQEP